MRRLVALSIIVLIVGMAHIANSEDKESILRGEDYIDSLEDEELEQWRAEASYEALSEHTRKYHRLIRQDQEALGPIIAHAKKKEEAGRVLELKMVLNDYNSFLDDLELMLVILEMREMIKEESLLEYYHLQAENHEKIKFGFSIRNEMYLNRIAGLKDLQACAFEQALLNNFQDYCIFDLNILSFDFDEEGQVEVSKDKKDWQIKKR